MKRNFTIGEVYRPQVHIKKVKNGKATVIQVSGEDYVLRHKDQFRGGKRSEERY